MLKKSKSAYWLYFLGAYVIIQFIWWGYHLIQLSSYIPQQDAQLSKRVGMVFGEGAVFLVILAFGIYRIRKSISKELAFQQQQQNFLLTVTHELKTPIAALKLYIQTLQKHNLPEDKKDKILNGALQENERLSQLIENILNASRAENKLFAIQKQRTELVALVQSIKERYQARYHIGLIDFKGPEELFAAVDLHMLDTILVNLIENAIKYGGTQQHISIQMEKLDRFVALKISDEGPGIDPLERQHIFEKFYRIGSEETRKQAGSGLGLYIVAEYVRLHDGQIRCIENKPSGSIFELILPI
jgi:signal transduction histidine kinase